MKNINSLTPKSVNGQQSTVNGQPPTTPATAGPTAPATTGPTANYITDSV